MAEATSGMSLNNHRVTGVNQDPEVACRPSLDRLDNRILPKNTAADDV